MSPIALEFFGSPRILRDGTPVHLPRRKATALLAYLVVTEQPHHRDVLAALLWPEMSQRRARANLRQTLYSLNKALGPANTVSEAGDVALPPQPDLTVDVVQFCNLLQAVAAHNHPSPHLCDACIANLTRAADLYHSDFLAGFSLEDAPEFEQWQLWQRETLQNYLSNVLEQLALIFAEAGHRHFDLAIAYARRRLALDPLHEPAHRILMLLYAESGDRVAAARQYEECERVLDEELGVDPDAETTALNEQIRQGLITAEHESSSFTLLTSDNLPMPGTSFVGRSRELGQIAERLVDPDCRLLTIVGPGGSGKTRLAIQAASGLTTHFRDGVHFVDLAPVESADLLATTILRSLDAPESGASDPRRRLYDYLSATNVLLVLDNFEHLLAGVDLLPELLHAAPKIKLMVTSRVRLNLQEEWLEPLEGLSMPPGPEPGLPAEEPKGRPDLEAYDATQLFVSRMHRLRPNYVPDASSLSDADAVVLVDICRMLEGMPLAIELAAGWTRTLSLAELQQEIRNSLALLHTSMQDVPPRLRSMRAAFDHSWQLLAPQEKKIMRRMSIFRGGCTRDAAEKITGATLDDLAGLVDKSWLRLREGGRYTMHELARQYCEEKLQAMDDDAGEDSLAMVHLRHSTYYGRYIGDVIKGTNYRPATLDNILVEFGNLRAALSNTVVYHHLEAADSICWSVHFVGDMMGWLHYSIDTLETVVPQLKERLAEIPQTFQDRTDIAHVLGVILQAQFSQYSQLGMQQQARNRTKRLEALVERMHPGRVQRFWRAIAFLQRMNGSNDLGNYSDALQYGRNLLALLEAPDFECLIYGAERGAGFWTAQALNGISYAEYAKGNYDSAEKHYTRGLAIREATREQRFKAHTLERYAELLLTMGQQERGEELAREGLRLSEVYGDRLGIALGHLAVGIQLVAQNRGEEARQHLYQSLERGRYSGRLDLMLRSLCQLGRMDLAEDKSEDARRCFEDALVAREQAVADPNNALVEVWLGLGWCALAESELSNARRMFAKAQNQHGALAYQIQESNAGLAEVLLKEGEVAEAAVLLHQVMDHRASAAVTRRFAQQQLTEISA